MMCFREVEACCHLLASLCTCLQHLMTLREWSEKGSLFPAGVHTASELFATADSINQYCFYGRCIGVQVNLQAQFNYTKSIHFFFLTI